MLQPLWDLSMRDRFLSTEAQCSPGSRQATVDSAKKQKVNCPKGPKRLYSRTLGFLARITTQYDLGQECRVAIIRITITMIWDSIPHNYR